ncbi:alpha/beta hydrolase [Bacillus sp. Cr_A10]|nr:alpha/beta hydrolase [Bacillus sp. Cr_A10]MDF2067977.1 alpha/beta hydrolase [Bacillus sp. Cr_A10]
MYGFYKRLFRRELSLEQFHFVTHDWGSLIGTRWACSNPERVHSLIIADATYSPDFVWHKDALIMRSLGGGEQFIEYLKNKSVFEGFIKKSIPNLSQAIVEDFYNLFSDPIKIKIALELYRSGDMDKLEIYRGRLAEFLSMPVSIIFGEHDTYILPEYGRKLKDEELHHANYYIIPGAGHFTPLEAPIEFIAILTKHLKSV